MIIFFRTVGSANIILSSNETESVGVPKEVLEKLPKMSFKEMRSDSSQSSLPKTDSACACSEQSGEPFVSKVEKSKSESESVKTERAVRAIEEQEPSSGLAADPDDPSHRTEECDSSAFSRPRGVEHDGVICEICQCDYDLADDVTLLPCKHFYHQHCIGDRVASFRSFCVLILVLISIVSSHRCAERWLGQSTTCPKCRFEVSPAEQVCLSFARHTTLASGFFRALQ